MSKIPVSQAYLVSMYWSVTTLTTIGYGDISPVLPWKRSLAFSRWQSVGSCSVC